MTNKQKVYKSSLIKAIHSTALYNDIYKNDRDLYETMLNNRYKVFSSKDLSIDELKNLLSFLKGEDVEIIKSYATTNQITEILYLWRQNSIQKDEKSLLTLIYNRFNLHLTSIYELEKKDFKKVIGVVRNIKVKTFDKKNNLTLLLNKGVKTLKSFNEQVCFSKSKLRLLTNIK